jgi:hypothetical protein
MPVLRVRVSSGCCAVSTARRVSRCRRLPPGDAIALFCFSLLLLAKYGS